MADLFSAIKGLTSKRQQALDSAEKEALGLRTPPPATALTPAPQAKKPITVEEAQAKAARFKWELENPGKEYVPPKMAAGGLVSNPVWEDENLAQWSSFFDKPLQTPTMGGYAPGNVADPAKAVTHASGLRVMNSMGGFDPAPEFKEWQPDTPEKYKAYVEAAAANQRAGSKIGGKSIVDAINEDKRKMTDSAWDRMVTNAKSSPGGYPMMAKGGKVKMYPSGGKITGVGGPTEDKQPVLASPGEFILPADTVKKVGVRNLEKLIDDTHEPTGVRDGIHFGEGDNAATWWDRMKLFGKKTKKDIQTKAATEFPEIIKPVEPETPAQSAKISAAHDAVRKKMAEMNGEAPPNTRAKVDPTWERINTANKSIPKESPIRGQGYAEIQAATPKPGRYGVYSQPISQVAKPYVEKALKPVGTLAKGAGTVVKYAAPAIETYNTYQDLQEKDAGTLEKSGRVAEGIGRMASMGTGAIVGAGLGGGVLSPVTGLLGGIAGYYAPEAIARLTGQELPSERIDKLRQARIAAEQKAADEAAAVSKLAVGDSGAPSGDVTPVEKPAPTGPSQTALDIQQAAGLRAMPETAAPTFDPVAARAEMNAIDERANRESESEARRLQGMRNNAELAQSKYERDQAISELRRFPNDPGVNRAAMLAVGRYEGAKDDQIKQDTLGMEESKNRRFTEAMKYRDDLGLRGHMYTADKNLEAHKLDAAAQAADRAARNQLAMQTAIMGQRDKNKENVDKFLAEMTTVYKEDKDGKSIVDQTATQKAKDDFMKYVYARAVNDKGFLKRMNAQSVDDIPESQWAPLWQDYVTRKSMVKDLPQDGGVPLQGLPTGFGLRDIGRTDFVNLAGDKTQNAIGFGSNMWGLTGGWNPFVSEADKLVLSTGTEGAPVHNAILSQAGYDDPQKRLALIKYFEDRGDKANVKRLKDLWEIR